MKKGDEMFGGPDGTWKCTVLSIGTNVLVQWLEGPLEEREARVPKDTLKKRRAK